MLVTAPPVPKPAPNATPASTRSVASPRVTAVLVVRQGAPRLPETLDALAGSSLPPDRLLVVDLDGTAGSPDLVRHHAGLRRTINDVTVVEHPAALPFGKAVALAVSTLRPEPDTAPEWLWLLRDDTGVDPSTLRQLVEAVRRSPSVGVAGPKIVHWDDPRRLVQAGHQLTRSGRRIPAPAPGELDQGQYDTRTDVLAVGTAGMLVRRSLFEQLGGFDPAFPRSGGDLDFGWRAQLAGHRVVLVPSARVRDAGATEAGHRGAARDGRAARRAARRVCLTRCSPLMAPLLAAWMVLGALLSALLLLVLKRPRAAGEELSDLGALLAPVRCAGARWRFRGQARLHRRDLATLFVRPGHLLRHTVDQVHDALTPDGPASTGRPSGGELAEPGPVADEAQAFAHLPASVPQRMFTNPGVLAVAAATGVAVVGMRESLGKGLLDASGPGLSGGQLYPVATDSSGLWHAFRDSWHGSGFGTSADSGPHLAVLAGLTWLVERVPFLAEGRSPASVTLTLLIVLGMPLATAGAYLAGRVVTAGRWVRAGLALAWGTAGVTAAAVADGRVTVVLAVALLPLVAAGVARTASPLGTPTAAFATALGLGLLGALVPVLLVVGALAALVLLVRGRGWAARGRALVVLVVPVALQGPSVLSLRDPARLLAGPGALAAADQAHPPWLLALASLDSVPTWMSLLAVPVLAAGVLGLNTRAGSRGGLAARAGLAALAALGLVLALAAAHVGVGVGVEPGGTAGAATPWPGVGVSLLLLALLAGALLGSASRPPRPAGPRWGMRRLAAGAGVAVVGIAVLAGAATVAARGGDAAVRVGGQALPAVAVDQAQGPLANRVLVLERTAAQQIDYELVGSEPGAVLRALPVTRETTDLGLADIVDALTAATPATAGSSERLFDLGIGFVTARAPADDPLTRALDAAPGLTRLGSADGQSLWRVLARPNATAATEAVPPSRVRLTTSTGAALAAVPVTGPHGAVDAELTAGPGGRRAVFAEPPQWATRAQVRFDGVPLTARADPTLPTYELPERPGRLTVDLPPAFPRWFLGQVVLTLVVVYLAIPFGNRRSRSRL